MPKRNPGARFIHLLNPQRFLRRKPNEREDEGSNPGQPPAAGGGMFPALQPQGYLIEYGVGNIEPQDWHVDLQRDITRSEAFRHQFCGPHDLAGAQCPNCAQPMLRFLALDTRDPRLNLGEPPFAVLPVLFCWRCPVAQNPLSYRVLDCGDVSLLQYGRGTPETDWPYEDFPVAFPGVPARLAQISDVAQHMLTQFNLDDFDASYPFLKEYPRLMTCRHQYGGEPFLIQRNTEYQIDCPSCSVPMPFLASIGDDCLDPRGFTGNEYVQVLYHYCRACRVISAFQQCD